MYNIVSDSALKTNEFGHEVCNFYPDRVFNTVTIHSHEQMAIGNSHIHYVPLWGESYCSYENLIAFYLADKFNIKVVAYGCKNLFPYYSLVSHECVMVPDLKKAWNDFRKQGDDGEWDRTNNPFIGWYTIQNFFPTYPPGITTLREANTYEKNDFGLYKYGEDEKFFLYDGDIVGINKYAYYELIRQTHYHPTVDELIDFYKDRIIKILQSSYDESQEIFESELYEHDKTDWFEWKNQTTNATGIPFPPEELRDQNMQTLFVETYFSDTVMENTLNINEKCLQKYIGENCPNSFLTCQLLSSLNHNKVFHPCGGAANFMTSIPHLNCGSMVSNDDALRQGYKFKKRINNIIFDHDVFISLDYREYIWDKQIGIYGKWLKNKFLRYERNRPFGDSEPIRQIVEPGWEWKKGTME